MYLKKYSGSIWLYNMVGNKNHWNGIFAGPKLHRGYVSWPCAAIVANFWCENYLAKCLVVIHIFPTCGQIGNLNIRQNVVIIKKQIWQFLCSPWHHWYLGNRRRSSFHFEKLSFRLDGANGWSLDAAQYYERLSLWRSPKPLGNLVTPQFENCTL